MLRCGLTIYPYLFYHTLNDWFRPLLCRHNKLVYKALRHPCKCTDNKFDPVLSRQLSLSLAKSI
uniref:Uncharacterized protein n=1 Tax=Siphoviridae sp. ct37J14 TaxID=2826280 RepID=A0A8S5M0U0_9CAUD|nr:MAG TPA: hypothetical protein [Siphoviridae sp. ct37J14]